VNVIFQVLIIIAIIALPLFTIAIFAPVSTSAQNMTGNMTSNNTTQGANAENKTNATGKVAALVA
jgi:hypothetical protein